MNAEIEDLLGKYDLIGVKDALQKYLSPCVAFDLKEPQTALNHGASKVGGEPDLPETFIWPVDKGRPLDFVLQIDLAIASTYDSSNLLPKVGLLSFFYDLENQPWGFDPKDLNGYKVVHSRPDEALQRKSISANEYKLSELEVVFRSALSVPFLGSSSYDDFANESNLESDEYWDFAAEVALLNSTYPHAHGGHHRLLGHAENVQGDMQLEAELVTHNLYCGDASGYHDPRGEMLKHGANDWLLLLQLDSDYVADFMWGDLGMLYYWIRKQDLAERRFDKVWMTLQCG